MMEHELRKAGTNRNDEVIASIKSGIISKHLSLDSPGIAG